MSQPITVELLSDDDEPQNEAVPPKSNWQVTLTSSNPNAVDCEPTHNAVATPLSPQPKRQRIEPSSNPTIFFIDDDPTPKKATFPVFTPSPIVVETPMRQFSNAGAAIVKRDGEGFSGAMFPTCTPLIVADNPVLDFPNPNVSIVKCKSGGLSDPRKLCVPISTPSIVAETPFSSPDVAIVECNSKGLSDPQKFSGICGLICLASDDESETDSGIGNWKQSDNLSSSLVGSDTFLEVRKAHENLTQMPAHSCSLQISSEDGSTQENNTSAEEIDRPEPRENILKRNRRGKVNVNKGNDVHEGNKKRKKMKEEGPWQKEEKDQPREREKLHKEAIRAEAELKRVRLKEEKNQLKEREKLQKAAMKAEAAELKKLEKEKQQWEKGKFALNSIVANVDAKLVELGSVGGHLLTRFAEKGLTYRITSNPIERSVVWNMAVPDQISKLSSNSNVISYVLVVVEAEEFCKLVLDGTLIEHVSCVRSQYPSHTICYVTNRLMAYINKREQEQYKNPDKRSCWRRPPVEEVLAKLATHYVRVHSRQCLDEAELAEHVVGLTRSLASCRFRKELTRLSVNANGSLIPKDCIDKDLFRKNSWLKALIAIPKVQPRFALAIQKKYPTMRSLLSVYMDPTKSVHEKEFLLKDLTIEGLLGDDRRLGEVCSKRVYRILTAQSGSSNTEDVEDGADFFSQTSTTPL